MKYIVLATLALAANNASACDSDLLYHSFRMLAAKDEVNLCNSYTGKVILEVSTASWTLNLSTFNDLLLDGPIYMEIILYDGCNVPVMKEMLDQPIFAFILNDQMTVVQDLSNLAFQKIFNSDPGSLEHGFLRCPETKKCQ